MLLFSETGHLRRSIVIVIAVSGPTNEENPCFANTSEFSLSWKSSIIWPGCRPGERRPHIIIIIIIILRHGVNVEA